jgi:serine/threonine protein kinase/tetratricopeptide (TPR) repeat protein
MELPAAFGKYELLERIGTGGMAEVFLARSFGMAGFERRLVIKRIRPELEEDPRFREMFVHEAKVAVRLNHPNVVQVYELDRVGPHLYMAMEHLHGRDLTRTVRALRALERRIPPPIAVAIVAEVCRGLGHAHARTDASGRPLGLVHQDVSPHNIVLTFTGEVKLVDFGIARLMNSAEGPSATDRPGGGKYAYMSPEQATGAAIDHRSDLFSTGIVLWELLVGRRLFQDPDPSEKLRRVVGAVIPHPEDCGAPIDASLWAILQRALARDRADRYDNAALFEEDLRAWLFDQRSRADRADIASLLRELFPEEADRRPEDRDLRDLVADLDRLAAEDDTGGRATAREPSDPPRTGRPSERKPVVVVMIDVDGLTDLSNRLDPEQLFCRHFELLRWVRRVVDRYGGTLQRAVDDHVTLLFGLPRTSVDDVPRALECALELQRTVGQLSQRGLHVAFAIGVHAGEVTVQQVRHRVRYIARGDTTRLARRLSEVADHGQILVSDRIRAGLDGRFSLRQGPRTPSRGDRQPMVSYVLEGRPPGLRITSSRGPWLRRGQELEAFRRAVVELQGGKGSTVAIAGGVGTGKSRLLREIRDLAVARHIPVFGARCATVSEDAPLSPFADLVREIVAPEGRRLDDPILEEALASFGLSDRDREALAALLGTARPSNPPERSETILAISRLFAALARTEAFIAVLDDAHNLRSRELDAFLQLLDAAAGTPVLFLLTWRGALPERLRGRARVIALTAFDGERVQRLATALLGAVEIDDELLALVARVGEGNPLYVVELLKWLVPDRVEVRDGRARLVHPLGAGELPHTLAGLISARIDALPPAAKGALQLAAMIGATFDEGLLATAAGLDDPAPILHELASTGLVNRAEDGDWSFASELVHESALRGLLGVQRRDHHRLIARAIESRQDRPGGPLAEALVRHCAASGRHLDAARYAYAAGRDVATQGDLERARSAFLSGLEALRQAARTPDAWDARTQGEALLQLELGEVCLQLGEAVGGARALQLALDIASDSGLPAVEARAHLALGRYHHWRGKHRMAHAHFGQARAVARLAAEREHEREALEGLAGLAADEGRVTDCEAAWREALALAAGDPAATATCEIGLADRYLRSGHTDEARALLDHARAAARAAADRVLESRVLNSIGRIHLQRDQFDEALQFFRAALDIRAGLAVSRGVVINHHHLGEVHFRRGDLARAHVAFVRARELAEEMGWVRGIVQNDVFLAYIRASRGKAPIGDLDAAIARARQLHDGEATAHGEWLFGRWLRDRGEVDAATERYDRALDAARQGELLPMMSQIAREHDQPPSPS